MRLSLYIWLRRTLASRPPDFRVLNNGDVYLNRWWVIPRNKWFNIYLHQFLRSDDDRALHDHPWVNLSILLHGHYVEETIKAGGTHRRVLMSAGRMKLRRSVAAHRVELVNGAPCWSLFITGPTIRVWGFHCKYGWRPFEDFIRKGHKMNDTGLGCGGLE